MKTFHKVLLVAIVAIFSFGYASADFRFGIKGGLNFSKLDLKIKDLQGAENFLKDEGNRTGWMAGVMAEFTIPIVNIGADASILYARQNIDDNSIYENKNFLDIPVNLKWKISIPMVSRIISPIIYTGPDFLFALNKQTLEDIKTKTCEVGWNVGLGVELFRHLQIEAGYCIGLNNVVDMTDRFTGVGINTVDYKVKKNYWSLTAAYLF
ncbi:MAG: PorT family protein [Muribaculaceae bacterium]|nr:PorT family protein [Muribaculaceae bacterium]